VDSIGTIQILLLMTLAVVACFGRRLVADHLACARELWSQLRSELLGRTPIHSAETIERREAQFIRDGLARRWPRWVIVLGVALAVAALAMSCVEILRRLGDWPA